MKDLRRIISFAGDATLMAPNNSKSQGKERKSSQVKLYKFNFKDTFIPLEKYPEILIGKTSEIDHLGEKVKVSSNHSTKREINLVHSYSLPPHYDKLVRDARFAITKDAMNVINYLLLQAMMEDENPIYSNYRKDLPHMSKHYIDCAISLIFDFIYDENTKYWRRDKGQEISEDALKDLVRYTLWRGRVAKEFQSKYADIDSSKYGHSPFNYSDKSNYHIYNQIKDYEKFQDNYVLNILGKNQDSAGYFWNEKIDSIKKDVDKKESFIEGMSKKVMDGLGSISKGHSTEGPSLNKINLEQKKQLKLFRVFVSYEKQILRGLKLKTISGGAFEQKVSAYNEQDAIRMSKNFVTKELKLGAVIDEFVSYEYEAKEVNTNGVTLEKEGVITPYPQDAK